MVVLAALVEDWPTAAVILGVTATVGKLVYEFFGPGKARAKKTGVEPADQLTDARVRGLERRIARLEGQFDALVHKIMDMLKDG